MNTINERLLFRQVRGGLKSLVNGHPEWADYYPRVLWGPLMSRIVRALWCAISGANRMKALDKRLLRRHARLGFLSFARDYPELADRFFPSRSWSSATKRIVGGLWSVVRGFDGGVSRPVDPFFRCDTCKRPLLNVREIA
jgi:hypothetical protein